MRNILFNAIVAASTVLPAAVAANDHTFVHEDADARWLIELDGAQLHVVVVTADSELRTGLLAADEGDVEIRDLPDGSAVPAVAHRGRLGACWVSVDVGLEREAAWLSIHDCEPDSALPGNWQGLLTLLPENPTDASPGLNGWIGRWVMTAGDTDAGVDIAAAENGQLHVYGLATRQVSATSIHDGEFESVLTPDGDRLMYDVGANDGDACRVALQLAVEALQVSDNGRCGGRGVSFNGSYTRRTNAD